MDTTRIDHDARSIGGRGDHLDGGAVTTWMPAPLAAAVRRPVMLQHWRRLTFLHWPYPPPAVQALLPPGLEVETFDGAAWVGLVPFLMDGVRPPGVPPVPWASRFPETNVRTYALGPDGRGAIWFLSLDAARLGAVLTARAGYALPYFWSRMSVGSGAAPGPGVTGAAGPGAAGPGPRVDRLAYRGRRRWPRPAGAGCDADVEMGAPFEAELGPLDHFLTARYRLWTVIAGRLAAADAEHPAWSLRRARVVDLEQDLLEAAGLPRPDGTPLVHGADGVRVRIGAWHRVRATAPAPGSS